jgi:beta-lactamase superfamily II metal-dependent hydrolase
MKVQLQPLPPNSDEIEFTLIGPGYGECGLVHLGGNNWIIVDSCIDKHTGRPAALEYLQKIGVDAASAVKLIVATHWHDDHVRGLTELLRVCTSATFSCSQAFTRDEFVQFIEVYNKNNKLSDGSGTREFSETFHLLAEARRGSRKAIENRLIFRLEAANSGHGHECNVTTLSPSDAQIDITLRAIGALIPQDREQKKWAADANPNHASVVCWIEIGPIKLLLGADLEEVTSNRGWAAIISSTERPQGKAVIFKVPHHGSSNAHNDNVWTEMLEGNPIAVLAPFNRTPLPSVSDRDRICGLTNESYATSKLKSKKPDKRPPMVERTIKEVVKKIEHYEAPIGMVRLRNKNFQQPQSWQVEFFNFACPLADIYS